MGTMIECKFCKTLLPGDSLYCYQCGNALGSAEANDLNDLEVDPSDAPEHLSEEDIPTSISTQNASTDADPLQDNPAVADSNVTVLNISDEEAHPSHTSTTPSEERPAEPITGEVVLVAESNSGERFISEEDKASADEDVEAHAEADETTIGGPELVYGEEEAVALDEQATVEQPQPLYADAAPIDDYDTVIEGIPYLEDDDVSNAITEPRMPVVFSSANIGQAGEEEAPIGYAMPSGAPSHSSTPPPLIMPYTSESSSRSNLSKLLTIFSTVAILLAVIIGLVITAQTLTRGEAASPMLTVSGNASPGGTIIVHGSHFIAGGDVIVLVDDSPITSVTSKRLALAEIQMAAVGQVQQQLYTSSTATVVRDDGSFDKAFIVPTDWQPGSNHTVRATENGANGNTVSAQLLVKVDDVIQTQQETPLPGTNPQVTVVAVSTVMPVIPTYPGPPPPAPTPTHAPKKIPTPKPTPKKTPTPKPTKTPKPTPIVPTATPTPVPVPTATATPTPVPVPTATPTPVPIPTATPTSVPVPTSTPTQVPVSPTATQGPPTPTPTLVVISPTLTIQPVTPTPTPGKHHLR
jgi:hypothetical protein